MPFHPGQVLFLFLAAMIAGTLNALAGGGSFISFPALLFVGIPPVEANATNTVALWPGLAASTVAYLKRLNAPARLLVPLLVTSVAGGWLGAVLLLKTPQHTFLHLVPWLLLGGTLLFAFGNSIRSLAGKSAAIDDLHALSWQAVAISSFVELLVAIYGGYFGAGIGFITLGMLTALGMRDIHAMGAISNAVGRCDQRGGGSHVRCSRGGSVVGVRRDGGGSAYRRMVWRALRPEGRRQKSSQADNCRGHRNERLLLCDGSLVWKFRAVLNFGSKAFDRKGR